MVVVQKEWKAAAAQSLRDIREERRQVKKESGMYISSQLTEEQKIEFLKVRQATVSVSASFSVPVLRSLSSLTPAQYVSKHAELSEGETARRILNWGEMLERGPAWMKNYSRSDFVSMWSTLVRPSHFMRCLRGPGIRKYRYEKV